MLSPQTGRGIVRDDLNSHASRTISCYLFRRRDALRVRPRVYLAPALAGALLCSCAHLESTSEPEATSTQPTPAPSVQLPPAPQQPPAPSRSSSAPRNSRERGLISLYDRDFSGKKTASGEPFDPTEFTMAHRTLPFGTRVRVTNLENHRSVVVVVNDRGPFVAGRIADLSKAAARRIDMVDDGVVEGVLDILEPAKKR